jgi:hypothetical protein
MSCFKSSNVPMDVLLGGAAAAALVYFGPRLLAAWLRWVREEERIPKETADSADLRTPVKKRTKALNISAAIMGSALWENFRDIFRER